MEGKSIPKVSLNNELECGGCGAILKFAPGTRHLKCDYCSAENEIRAVDEPVVIEETSLEEYLQLGLQEEDTIEVTTVHCDRCGASSTFEPYVSSDFCPFCDSPLVVKGGTTSKMYKPKYVLTFDIGKKNALESYRRWLKSLWFAPNDLKHYADNTDHFNGIYIPYWTYDCHTDTDYSGERGDDYTEQQAYNIVENGHNVTKMRSVTKTRWSSAYGRVSNFFDDILVIASKTIPKRKMEKIKAWDLNQLVPYNDKYLSGFRTETFQVKIEEGYQVAKTKMNNTIRHTVVRDIGGNRQRIDHMGTQYSQATFKQILLPVWISAYRYKGKVYQFLINGRTGAISGDRPYSKVKIGMTVLGVLAAIALISILTRP